MSGFDEERPFRRLENVHPAWRELLEGAYAADPARTHAKLVYAGYWQVAAQLKIDHAVGRLGEPRA